MRCCLKRPVAIVLGLGLFLKACFCAAVNVNVLGSRLNNARPLMALSLGERWSYQVVVVLPGDERLLTVAPPFVSFMKNQMLQLLLSAFIPSMSSVSFFVR